MSLLLLALAWASPDLDRLDAAMDAAEAAGVVHGELLVVDGGREVYRRRMGAAPEGGRYRIGSLSKSFTAVATLQLVDEGLLTLDTPVVERLPELPELGGPQPIRVRHLLTHTSGLGSLQVAPFAPEAPFDQWVAAIRATDSLNRSADPGASYRYSNGGYQLLSELVRRTRGTGFEAALNDHVWRPAGLVDTAITPGLREVPGHLVTRMGLLPSRRMLPRWLAHDYRWDMGGDGALTSSPDDLIRWGRAMHGGQLLSPASQQALISPVLDGYGMGWVVEGDKVWHNGALSPLGIYAYLRWSPTNDRVVAFVNAVDVSSVTPELRLVIEEALAGDPVPPITALQTVPGDLAMLSRLYAHWMLGLLPIGALAAWVRRPERTRVAILIAAMCTFGWSVATLSLAGPLGALVAAAGTAAATASAWPHASYGRPPFWLPMAFFASTFAAVGLSWAGLTLALFALMADPWATLGSIAP